MSGFKIKVKISLGKFCQLSLESDGAVLAEDMGGGAWVERDVMPGGAPRDMPGAVTRAT